MSKEFKLSPEMMKFFDRILSVKSFVKKSCEESNSDPILKEIYDRLHEAIKIDLPLEEEVEDFKKNT